MGSIDKIKGASEVTGKGVGFITNVIKESMNWFMNLSLFEKILLIGCIVFLVVLIKLALSTEK